MPKKDAQVLQTYEDKIEDFVAQFLLDDDDDGEMPAASPPEQPGPMKAESEIDVDQEAAEAALMEKKARHACYMRMSRSYESSLSAKLP